MQTVYLPDHELKALLDELEIETDGIVGPFDQERQIGPCSIDLRLSGVYWRPTKHLIKRGLRLDQTRLMELNARRGWQRYEASGSDLITIEPGEMVLARTAERFRVPPRFAGALEGRSSFARLGLEVHLAGGFINPGWQGHMPLTIVNHGTVALRIPVGAALCQMMLIQLPSPPQRSYEDRVDHKYQNDDGGPSYWWRDALFKSLLSHESLSERSLSELDEMLPKPDEGVLSRLDDFLSENPERRYGNTGELLDAFAAVEKRTETSTRLKLFVGQWGWSAALAVGLVIGAAWAPIGWLIFALLLVASSGGFLWWSRTELRVEQYLTPTRLAELRAKSAGIR